MNAIACVIGATCPGVGPQTVTSIRLGLSMAYDAGSPLFVPTWLFDVEGSSYPASIVAVQDQYLADPLPVDPGAVATASSVPGSTGAGSGSVGGSTPIPPGTAQPAPGVAVASPTSVGPLPVAITRASIDAAGTTLTVYGTSGLCETYSASAKEDGNSVYVELTGTPQASDVMCAAVAVEVSATATLQTPLGSRTVIDASSNSQRQVPVA